MFPEPVDTKCGCRLGIWPGFSATVIELGALVERSLITVDIVTQESFELHVLHHIISTKQVTEEPVVFDLLINKVAHSQRMVGGGGCTSQIVVATLELTVGAVTSMGDTTIWELRLEEPT